MSAKSGDVAQFGVVGQRKHYFFIGNKSSYWQSAPHALGKTKNIGHNAIMLEAEKLSRPAEANLYFIENEECPCFIASFAERFQETILRKNYSCFGLQRLNQNAGRPFGDLLQVVKAIEIQKPNVGQ